jgi:signal transduction histidine kinase
VLDDEHLAEEVTAAARLALENERLQAAVAVRIEELRASRARIVAAGDLERRRLERDLHDGAQQRLVALSLSLRLLRQQLADGAEADALTALDEAAADLDLAIAQLRELAHGIFPTVLADGGLAVAVRALAEDGHVPITVGGMPGGRFGPAVETAAYSVVAEAARAAGGRLLVRGERNGDALVLEIEEERGCTSLDAQALEDRLGALDGSLRVSREAGGAVTLRAEIPCES